MDAGAPIPRGPSPLTEEAEEMTTNKLGERVTGRDWFLVEEAVKAFLVKYPSQMLVFEKDLAAERTKWKLAHKEHKELRQANWRNIASFPVVKKPDGSEDSILPVLEKLMPGLTTKKGLLEEFLRKFPIFRAPEKV